MIAFSVLLMTVEATRAWAARPMIDYQLWLLWGSAYQLCGTLGATLGVVLGAASPWRGWRGGIATVVTTILAVGASFAVYDVMMGDMQIDLSVLSRTAFVLRCVWLYSVAGLLFAAYCAARERHMATMRAVQAVEIDRALIQRRVLESRLKVMQARIEPEFLFGTLEMVSTMYRRVPVVAERTLGELIAYLRAALPQMRGESSTIGRELELVRAYLAVLSAPLGEGMELRVDVDDDIGRFPFPPMILLPLVQTGAANGLQGRERVALSAQVQDALITVSVSIEGGARPERWRDDTLPEVRDTLIATFGGESSIRFESSAQSHMAVIVVPVAGRGEIPSD